MSPQKQAAQVANGKLSHGAVTEAGRARSSQNSVRHSLCSKKYLIVPEDLEEFNIHYAEMLAALAPEGVIERVLAEAIVIDEWRLIRARALENQIFVRSHMSAKEEFLAGADSWLAHSKELTTLTLYEQRINRVLTRNKAEFEAKQAARKAAEPAESKSETPAPEIDATEPVGFVHSNAAAGHSSLGFVHSSARIAASEGSQTQPEPVPTPPAATRRAA